MAVITAPDASDTERVKVARFSRYKDAKRAVDRLRVARIPERRITVLGRDIEWSPPLTADRSARLGGWLGMAAGGLTLLLLWSLGALAPEFSWLTAILAGGSVGGAVGGTMGLLVWRTSRDRRMLPESGHVDIGSYDVLVEEHDVPKARELLGR
jgi:hypothetical protein